MSTEKPLDDKALEQFLKDIHIEFGPGGFQVETAEKLAALARRAPVESVPAPVGLDLEAEEDRFQAWWNIPHNGAHEIRSARSGWMARAALSPRPATGASTSGRRETGPEIAKRLGIKVKDQQDQIDIESGKRIGEDPATGAPKCYACHGLGFLGLDDVTGKPVACTADEHKATPATGADQGGAK